MSNQNLANPFRTSGIDESHLGYNAADRLNGGKSLDPRHKSAGSHIDYHYGRHPEKDAIDKRTDDQGPHDQLRHKIAKNLGYKV
jgi:hypothetical protein